jgi:hypothetical protein
MIFSCAVSFESKKKNSGFIAATLYYIRLLAMALSTNLKTAANGAVNF